MEIISYINIMGTFKKFAEWLQEQDVASTMSDLQQKRVSTAVSKSLSSMAADQAMNAIQGTDQQAQKKLVSRTLAKPHVNTIDSIAPFVGIKIKSTEPRMMRKR